MKIRLGIIGAGRVTTDKNRHLDSIRSLNDPDVEIYAVADIVPGLAEKVARDNHIPYAFTDYRELLAMEEVNAVVINTNTAAHKAIAIESIRAGKHVYVEKPITMTTQELEEVLEETRKSDKVFLGGSNGLLQRQMIAFRKMIERGDLGEVYLVTLDRCASRAQSYGMEYPDPVDLGMGISAHSGSHNVEWALYLLGDPKPVAVQARGYFKKKPLALFPRMDHIDDDTCIATVWFDNGSAFLFKALRGAPAQDKYEMNVYGDKMSIAYDVHAATKKLSDDCVRFYRDDEIIGMEEIVPKMKMGKTHADMYAHFFECIRENKPSMSNGERGLVVMKILDAMDESIGQGGKQVLL